VSRSVQWERDTSLANVFVGCTGAEDFRGRV